MATVEITTGVGGDDAASFARDLGDSVLAWAARKHDVTGTTARGTRAVTITLPGLDAAAVRWLTGVHRIQHVPKPAQRAGGKHATVRQTSKVTLIVLDDLSTAAAVPLARSDPRIRVDTFRSTGHGGQGINTTDSAVRVTLLATGETTYRGDRSQYQNLQDALQEMAELIAARESGQSAQARQAERRDQAGPVVAFTHSTFESWGVKHHASGKKWSRREWGQGRFDAPSPATEAALPVS